MASAAEAAGGAGAAAAAERLEQAEKLREEGNAEFKAQSISSAKQRYEQALEILDLRKLGDCEDDLRARAGALRTPVLLNLALCCLKAEPAEAHRALECCEEALDLEPQNPKAMYRKAKALVELEELREAEWELARACRLLPKDATMRRDLEQLRQRQRDSKAKEKATFEGLFERGQGFASENRPAGGSSRPAVSDKDVRDLYFHDGEGENPYEGSLDPRQDALEAQGDGRLGDAVQAWEASIAQRASRQEWTEYFGECLDMGRVFMDINMDNLALRCFNKVLEPPEEEVQPLCRRHTLLLKAICLLNEAEKDPKVEVPAGLALWARAEGLPLLEEAGAPPLDQQIARWEEEARPQGSAAPGGGSSDLSVALGLLLLLEGPTSEAPRAFANALLASDVASDGCFSAPERLAVKWNMLGAVMANRGRHEDALVALEQALRLNQHYPRALMNQAISQSALGQHRQAASSCATALGKIPMWSTDPVWAMLQQTAGRVADGEELVEAVEKKNLTQVRKLLAPELAGSSKTDPEPEVAVLLRKIGF